MKRPDDETVLMLQRELNRIIEEVSADGLDDESSFAEQFSVIMLVVEVTMNTSGLPNRVRRKAFEILYRYYSMIEGLDKN